MRTMEWAARRDHLNGIPRRMIFKMVGTFAKVVANIFNTTTVYNLETLIRLTRHRPPCVPLLTVSNHMSTLDDPVMWGMKGFPVTDAEMGRWVLAAEDICFKNPVLSYFFRLGKCIPITRGGGIYQEHMNEALDRLADGAWLHTFPEGKVSQEDAPIRRLKWGTASLITRSPVTPIVLPIVHRGFEQLLKLFTLIFNLGAVLRLDRGAYLPAGIKPEVLPENYMFGRRPLIPLWNKEIRIVVGEPIVFDIPNLKQKAIQMSRDSSFPHHGWPKTVCGLDEAAQHCLYTTISEQIREAMQKLCNVCKSSFRTN